MLMTADAVRAHVLATLQHPFTRLELLRSYEYGPRQIIISQHGYAFRHEPGGWRRVAVFPLMSDDLLSDAALCSWARRNRIKHFWLARPDQTAVLVADWKRRQAAR